MITLVILIASVFFLFAGLTGMWWTARAFERSALRLAENVALARAALQHRLDESKEQA